MVMKIFYHILLNFLITTSGKIYDRDSRGENHIPPGHGAKQNGAPQTYKSNDYPKHYFQSANISGMVKYWLIDPDKVQTVYFPQQPLNDPPSYSLISPISNHAESRARSPFYFAKNKDNNDDDLLKSKPQISSIPNHFDSRHKSSVYHRRNQNNNHGDLPTPQINPKRHRHNWLHAYSDEDNSNSVTHYSRGKLFQCLNYRNPNYAMISNNINREPITNRIIVGEKIVNIENYPYQVAIYRNDVFVCGGAIITDEFILTAAHCVDSNGNPEDYSVKAGITNFNDEGQKRNVIRIFTPNEYIEYTAYDIAILLLHQPFEFNSKVGKIRLPDDGLCLLEDDVVAITGFGLTIDESDLFVVNVPLISWNNCIKFFKDLVGLQAEIHMCIEGREGDATCFGDSGGIMVIDGYVVGMPTIGTLWTAGKPEVFVSVTYFVKWIYEIILNY